MRTMIKHEWDNIIRDLENGLSRIDVINKYKVPKSSLSSKINDCFPHLKIKPTKEKTREVAVKIKPTKEINLKCHIMQRIEIIGLVNKKIPDHEVAKQLKMDIIEVRKIINKAKSGGKV